MEYQQKYHMWLCPKQIYGPIYGRFSTFCLGKMCFFHHGTGVQTPGVFTLKEWVLLQIDGFCCFFLFLYQFDVIYQL